MTNPPHIVAETLVESLLDLAHQANVIAEGLEDKNHFAADNVRHLVLPFTLN